MTALQSLQSTPSTYSARSRHTLPHRHWQLQHLCPRLQLAAQELQLAELPQADMAMADPLAWEHCGRSWLRLSDTLTRCCLRTATLALAALLLQAARHRRRRELLQKELGSMTAALALG